MDEDILLEDLEDFLKDLGERRLEPSPFQLNKIAKFFPGEAVEEYFLQKSRDELYRDYPH